MACACGWETEPQPNHEAVKRAYCAHVEEALGAEAYYTAPVKCLICGSEHDQALVIGIGPDESVCERCGVAGRLRPNNEHWNESQARGMRWFG